MIVATPMKQNVPQAPRERVLSTMNEDGSRRWLRPRSSRGRFLTLRRIVAWFLIGEIFWPVHGVAIRLLYPEFSWG